MIHSAPVHKLNDIMYHCLYSLNYRDRGYMREVLTKCRNHDPEFYDGEVAYIIENGQVVAWSLVFKHTFDINTQHILHLYTRKSHRGKGLATQLTNYWTDRYSNLKGHQNNSSVFQRHSIRNVRTEYTYHLK